VTLEVTFLKFTEVFVVSSPAATSLLAHLEQIPDPRSRFGLRHPFTAMLASIVCALLTGARGYEAIAQWTKSQGPTVWRLLGFKAKSPCPNCFRDLLLRLDPEALEAVLRQWIAAWVGEPSNDELHAVAIDGKTLCNTLAAHERNVQLLALFDHKLGCVLSQQAVDPSTNEAKAALPLLRSLVLDGTLITGDAMFCQREICQQIVDSGGDYLFVVKDNQPELKAAIEAEFQPGFSPLERSAATTIAL
jgi:hypothetical protein